MKIEEAEKSAPLPGQVEDWLEYLSKVRGYSPLTLRAYRSDLRQLVGFLQERGQSAVLTELRPPVLYQWAVWLGEQYAPATVRRKLDVVSSLMNHLRNLGIIERNPLATIPRPKRQRKIPSVPSPEECRRLLAACRRPAERVVLALLIFCGLRKAELIGLDRNDVAQDLGALTIRQGKGGHQRVIPLCQSVRDILCEYLQLHPGSEGPLVCNRVNKRLGSTSLQRLFKRVAKRAGLAERGLTLHSLRHGFATQLVTAGVNLRSVQQLLGHRSLTSTQQYLHLDQHMQEEAVGKLEARLQGGLASRVEAENCPSKADPNQIDENSLPALSHEEEEP